METRSATARVGSPKIIEIIGPAGAGKSTLVKECLGLSSRVLTGPPSSKAARAITFPWYFAKFVPLAAVDLLLRRVRHIDSLFQMAYLDSLAASIRGWRSTEYDILLLDQGPVFLMTYLELFGPNRTESQVKNWWQSATRVWSEILDGIVWLDASDLSLRDRVTARSQEHRIKSQPVEAHLAFNARYRAGFESTLAAIKSSGDIAIARFNSEDWNPRELAREVMQVSGIHTSGELDATHK